MYLVIMVDCITHTQTPLYAYNSKENAYNKVAELQRNRFDVAYYVTLVPVRD